MISNTTTIIIIIVLILLFIIIGVALYLNSKPAVTGTTGATATCSNSCNIIPKGCSSLGILTIGYSGVTGSTGTTCPNTCLTTTDTTNISGCLAPVCGSPFCTPQQALYTNINANGSLVTFCSSGLNNPNLISNPCPNPITGSFLASLGIQSSNIAKNQLFPIYITTIKGSIYGTTQPNPPSGIDPNSIQINNTDPTVIDNPYVLYAHIDSPFVPTSLSFQRINDIRNDLQNATWIYDSTEGNLVLFNTIGSVNPTKMTVSVLNYYNLNANYFGPLPPCGDASLIGSGAGVTSLTYNANTGYFNVGQINNPQFGDQQLAFSNLVVSPDQETVLNTGYLVTALPVPNVNYGGTCNFRDVTRWYSISSTSNYL